MEILGCKISCTWSSCSPRSLQVMLCRCFSSMGYNRYLFINTKTTGPLAVHFKLLFQNHWSEAETWDLSHQHPGDSWLSLEFHASAAHCSVSRTLLSLHRDTCNHGSWIHGSWNAACWQCSLPVPWQLVPLQCFMESPSPQGCGAEGRGAEPEAQGLSEVWVRCPAVIDTFPHPSPGLPQHNGLTLSKWRHEPNTEKSLRFAEVPHRLAVVDLIAWRDVQLYQQRPVQISTKTTWLYHF